MLWLGHVRAEARTLQAIEFSVGCETRIRQGYRLPRLRWI